MRKIRYMQWHDHSAEDMMRFYALRLREAGLIVSTPNRILAEGTDCRFLDQIKRELKA